MPAIPNRPRPYPPCTRRTLLAAAAGSCALPLLAACGFEDERALDPAVEPGPPPPPQGPVPWAIVLSGGGVRGLAHAGAVRALAALGLVPDLVVGSSVGALIGGLYAGDALDIVDHDAESPRGFDAWASAWISPSQRTSRIEALVASALGQTCIEDLPRRFVAVATARDSGRVVPLGHGDAARAIAASCALPGAFAPVRVRGTELVDGSMAQPLPVRTARALGAARVVAVDVSWHPQVPAPSGIADSILHAGFLMGRNLTAVDRRDADVLIEPVLPLVADVTVANAARLVEAGFAAVMRQAWRIRACLAAAPTARASTGAAPVCPDAAPHTAADAPAH